VHVPRACHLKSTKQHKPKNSALDKAARRASGHHALRAPLLRNASSASAPSPCAGAHNEVALEPGLGHHAGSVAADEHRPPHLEHVVVVERVKRSVVCDGALRWRRGARGREDRRSTEAPSKAPSEAHPSRQILRETLRGTPSGLRCDRWKHTRDTPVPHWRHTRDTPVPHRCHTNDALVTRWQQLTL